MTSKKSFLVNIKTNIRRRVWLIVVMFLGFFFVMPVLTAMNLNMQKLYYHEYGHLDTYLGRVFASFIGLNEGMGLFVSLLAVIAAIQGFSYMYQRRKLDMYMSMPVAKGRRFAAVYLNGLLAYFVSYLINMLLSFLVARTMGADISLAFGEAAAALLGYTVLYLAVYHVAILAVMLTGNLIVTLMGTAVLLFYDGIAYTLLIGYMSTFFSSFYYRTEEAFDKLLVSPVIRFFMLVGDMFSYENYMYARTILWDRFAKGIIPILIAAVIAFALAYWCYTKKPAEVCGKSMAFPKTKAVIKILITIQAGLAGGVIFYSFSGSSMVFFVFGMLAGTLLCHGVIEVIYDFDIRSVKNGWRSLLISAACVAAVFSIFQFDLIRYDSYVPEPDQVDNIAFSFSGSSTNYYDENLNSIGKEKYIFDNMQITDIRPVLELAGRRMGTEIEDVTEYRYCVVQYVLKNGKKIYRQFPTAYREDTALLDEIVTDSAYQKASYTIYNEPLMGLGSKLRIYYDGGSGRREVTDFSVEELKNAYRKDLQGFTFTETMEQLVQGRFTLECIEQGMYVATSFPVYPSFANTISLLREAGCYTEEYLEPDNVEQIIVSNSNSAMYDSYVAENGYGTGIYSYQDFNVEIAIDDPEEIKRIADAVYPENFNEFWMPDGTLDTDYYVTVIYKKSTEDTDSYASGYYILADRIPDFVKERTAYTEEK